MRAMCGFHGKAGLGLRLLPDIYPDYLPGFHSFLAPTPRPSGQELVLPRTANRRRVAGHVRSLEQSPQSSLLQPLL